MTEPQSNDAPTKCEALNEVINELEASEAPFYRGIEKLKAHRRVHLAERHQIKLALNLPDMSYEPNLAEAVTAQLELLRAEQLRLSRELEEASAALDALQQQADALRKALIGPDSYGDPELSRIGWLGTLLRELRKNEDACQPLLADDPQSFWECMDYCEALVREARAALAASPSSTEPSPDAPAQCTAPDEPAQAQ